MPAPPKMHFGRRARTDVVLDGELIEAGDVVTLWNTSANRPESFDLARSPNKHVTFGYGPHFCLGAFLGRAELHAMLTTFRHRVAAIELRGEPARLHSDFLRGYTSFPVSLTPARRA